MVRSSSASRRRGACTVAADLAEENMDRSRCSVRFLVFSASLRRESYNTRLASLAASVLEDKGASVDRATMHDFECPYYDGDVEAARGIPDGATRLRDRLVAADAYIIAAPE